MSLREHLHKTSASKYHDALMKENAWSEIAPSLQLSDLTLWPLKIDELEPPLNPFGVDSALDSKGNLCSLFPGVKEMLSTISMHYNLAIASRVEDIASAYQLMHFSGINSFFSLKEIYPTSKSIHLLRLHRRSGVPLEGILFFDDDWRNIRDTNRIGVRSYQVVNGLTWSQFYEGLKLFPQI